MFLKLDMERIQSEQPLEPPPKPPQERRWRGSTVAPFAGNNMLVLYKCPAQERSTGKVMVPKELSNSFLVQILHNEKPVSILVSIAHSYSTFSLHLFLHHFFTWIPNSKIYLLLTEIHILSPATAACAVHIPPLIF